MTRYLFRCREDGCGHLWAFDYPIDPPRPGFDPRRDYPAGPAGFTTPKYDKIRGCPKCKGIKKPEMARVRGVYSAAMRCDERCTQARGASCSCSCAGANHGQAHLACDTQEKT